MKLLRSIKSAVTCLSYSQKYARQHGYNLTRLNEFEWGISRGDGIIICKFPNELQASRYIYELNITG
jgi:hypothetical protein